MWDTRTDHRTKRRWDRPAIVWLTLGMGVALGLTFALGFILGRRAERIAAVESTVADPVAKADSEKAIHDELTFYSTLTDTKPAPDASVKEAPVAAATPPAAPPKAEPVTPPPPKKKNLESAVARARHDATRHTEDELRHALNAGPPKPGDFTVQVSAFQSMGEAKAYGAGLERKGYHPFVVTSTIPGRGTWYRVRLGRFTTEGAATDAKQLLARADIPAWVLQAD